MREVYVEQITQAVRDMCIDAACNLPEDEEKLLREAVNTEVSEFGKYSLEKIVKNVEVARNDMDKGDD